MNQLKFFSELLGALGYNTIIYPDKNKIRVINGLTKKCGHISKNTNCPSILNMQKQAGWVV